MEVLIMAKLTTAQVTILRTLREAGGAAIPFPGSTRSIGPLQRMFAIKSAKGGWVITPTGRTYLDEYERAAEYKRAGLERASRPVPASAFVEPSAKNAPVLDHEYEDEPADEIEVANGTVDLVDGSVEPTVPQAWVDQLVTLLEHGARIVASPDGWVKVAGGWSVDGGRLDAAAREAIRRGIVRELPPTATGIVRLALVES